MRRATPGIRRTGGRPGRLLVTATTALLIFGVFLVHAAPVTGLLGARQTVGVGRIDEIDCDPSPAELEDIGFIAERDGISLDEAIARHGWQSCFVEVANYLEGAFPNQYAGAAVTDRGRGAWIAFKGDVPEEAAALAEAIPVTVQLIGGRGFSQAELDEVFLEVYYAIFGHEEVVTAGGGYDIATGVITIQVQLRDSLEHRDQREQFRQVLLPQQPANPAITVQVIIVDELGGADDASPSQAGGVPRPAVYAGAVAAAVLALLAGLLVRGRARKLAEGLGLVAGDRGCG